MSSMHLLFLTNQTFVDPSLSLPAMILENILLNANSSRIDLQLAGSPLLPYTGHTVAIFQCFGNSSHQWRTVVSDSGYAVKIVLKNKQNVCEI
jgi:hypothetical protein